MCHVKVDEKTEKISIALRKDDHRPVTAAAVTAARSRIECEKPADLQKYLERETVQATLREKIRRGMETLRSQWRRATVPHTHVLLHMEK